MPKTPQNPNDRHVEDPLIVIPMSNQKLEHGAKNEHDKQVYVLLLHLPRSAGRGAWIFLSYHLHILGTLLQEKYLPSAV